ncbi:MAG TPA: hypothetical protein PLK61_04045 [Nitrosomonas sp.]|nr:hypothetical protein [Nitrosomonas sp.]
MDQLFTSLVSIATAITGVAIVAVLVSRNSQTPDVIDSAGRAFSNALGVAVSPVSGGGLGSFTSNINLSGNRLY